MHHLSDKKAANKDARDYHRILFGRMCTLAILFMYVAFLLFQPFGAVRASAPYAASDALGKVNQSGAADFNLGVISGVGLNNPGATALDSVHHRLFVSSQYRVLVFTLDSNNRLTSHTATNVLGRPSLSSGACSSSTPTSSSLCNQGESGLVYDAVDNYLFVSEIQNNRVLVFNLSAGITDGMNASYVLGQTDFSGHGGGVSQSAMSLPGGLAFDTTNKRLFVADESNSRVLVFDISSGISNGMNASNVLGQADFTGSACNQSGSVRQMTLCQSSSTAWDATGQRLFVGDPGNHRVLVYDLSSGISNGMNAAHVLGQTDFNSINSSTTQHNLPQTRGLGYDSVQSRLFVSDITANRVAVYDLSSGITDGMDASYVLGQPDFTSSDCATTQSGMCLGASSNIAYDTVSKTLFFGDPGNNRVLVYDLSSGITNNMNASDLLGQITPQGTPVFTTRANDNLNPYPENAWYPEGSALDADHHRLFVADCNFSRVAEYDLNTDNSIASRTMTHVIGQASPTVEVDTATQAGLDCPSGVAYDAANNRLFVTDFYNNRVMVYDLSAGISNGMNAAHVLGQPDFTSSGSAATQNQLSGPDGLAYDAANHQLYVADSDNARVLVYNTSSLADGMNAAYVIGQPDFTSSAGNITQDGMSFPYGLALDTARHQLFVGDWGSAGRVLVYDTSNLANGMNASNVLGEADFTSSNSASDTGSIDNKSFGPAGLAYDPNNQRLFVSDGSRNVNRIMTFDLAGGITNNMAASGVLGQPDLTTGSGSTQPPTATNLHDPEGINGAYDTTHNRLYTADSSNGRSLVYTFADLKSADSLPAATAGTAYNSGVLGSQTQGSASYAVASGSLPAGLSLDTASGVISGTPQQSGTSTFSIRLSDDNGGAGIFTDTVSYTLAVSGGGSAGGGTSGSTTGTNSSTTTNSGSLSSQTTAASGAGTSSNTTTSPSASPIHTFFLNSLSGLFSPEGQTFDSLQPGDTLQLCATSDANVNTSLTDGTCTDKSAVYTITLAGIDVANQTVHFTINDPQDITIHVGNTSNVDINQDHTDDLSIGVNSINATANTASVTFKYLLAKKTAPSSGAASTQTTTPPNSFVLWLSIGGVAAVAIIVTIIVLRARRRA